MELDSLFDGQDRTFDETMAILDVLSIFVNDYSIKCVQRSDLKPNKRKLITVKHVLRDGYLNSGAKRSFRSYGEAFITNRNKLGVDYYADESYNTKNNITNAGVRTYVISPIDSSDKFSYSYRNCTGVIASGVSKESNRNISLMSHQDPESFLEDKKLLFIFNLMGRLKEFRNMVYDDSVECYIFGGNYLIRSLEHKDNYKKSIALLRDIIEETLEFTPMVIAGPNTKGGDQDVYYSTAKRELLILRSSASYNLQTEECFSSNLIQEQAEKWDSLLT